MKHPLRIVNLEHGMPQVSQAMQHLNNELILCRRLQIKVVKLIHGYGSSGTGGKIRIAVRRELAQRKQSGQIVDFIPGEDFSIFNECTRRAFAQCDSLRNDSDLDRYNNGVTFIIL